jgi:hypothetical protein
VISGSMGIRRSAGRTARLYASRILDNTAHRRGGDGQGAARLAHDNALPAVACSRTVLPWAPLSSPARLTAPRASGVCFRAGKTWSMPSRTGGAVSHRNSARSTFSPSRRLPGALRVGWPITMKPGRRGSPSRSLARHRRQDEPPPLPQTNR